MTELPTIPVGLRVHLAHAALQATADECGVDVLHIKGPAVDPALRLNRRQSVDADVLVRPADLKRYLGALRRFGWQEVTRLTSGGVVEHSVNWYHPELGQADIHVRFPGIQIESGRAFDRLCHNRRIEAIAHWGCYVPGTAEQWLILLLHAARNRCHRDTGLNWENATDAERHAVRALAEGLKAEVALGVVTGNLETYRDHPERDLWRIYRDGTGSTPVLTHMSAIAKAAPAGKARGLLGVIRYLLAVLNSKPQRLGKQLGRQPTILETISVYGSILLKVILELARSMLRHTPDRLRSPSSSRKLSRFGRHSASQEPPQPK